MTSKYSDGLAFRYEMPREDLSLRGVCIEDEQPMLLFDVSKKVPTLMEQEVAMCIRVVYNDNERPQFYYCGLLPGHPLVGTGRHFKQYKPLYMRRTPMGENLAEIDWIMKCLSIDVRTDKSKKNFFSWSENSNVDGMRSSEYFDYDQSKPGGVYMKCKSVHVFEDSNQLLFQGEPKLMVDWKRNPGYSKHITDKLDEIAYFDEPFFLKMKEYIKLILVVEWLKKKGIQFSQDWIQEQTKPTFEPPKPLQVELSSEERNSIIKKLKKDVKKAVKAPQLKQSLPSSKYEDRISVKKPTIKVDSRGFEATFERTIPDPFFESSTGLYVPVVQKVVTRATTHDFDFLYADIDPNRPVIFDPSNLTPVKPDVNSWSELIAETEVFPCKWLQDPNDVMCRTPALTGGVSTTSIPVERVQAPVPTQTCSVVPALRSRSKKKFRSRDVPPQSVVQAPPSSVCMSSLPVATGGHGTVMRGFQSGSSSSGMSKDGTKINQPSLHVRKTITELIGGKEVEPPLDYSMHIPLPPKAESECSDDSGYSSISVTPSPVPSDSGSDKTADSSETFNGEISGVELDAALRNLDPANASSPAVMAADKDDSSSVISDSGISSSATMDTVCKSDYDSDNTIADSDDGMEM